MKRAGPRPALSAYRLTDQRRYQLSPVPPDVQENVRKLLAQAARTSSQSLLFAANSFWSSVWSAAVPAVPLDSSAWSSARSATNAFFNAVSADWHAGVFGTGGASISCSSPPHAEAAAVRSGFSAAFSFVSSVSSAPVSVSPEALAASRLSSDLSFATAALSALTAAVHCGDGATVASCGGRADVSSCARGCDRFASTTLLLLTRVLFAACPACTESASVSRAASAIAKVPLPTNLRIECIRSLLGWPATGLFMALNAAVSNFGRLRWEHGFGIPRRTQP